MVGRVAAFNGSGRLYPFLSARDCIAPGKVMLKHREKIDLAMWFSLILSDAHLWAPLAVLIIGLVLLAWVS